MTRGHYSLLAGGKVSEVVDPTSAEASQRLKRGFAVASSGESNSSTDRIGIAASLSSRLVYRYRRSC